MSHPAPSLPEPDPVESAEPAGTAGVEPVGPAAPGDGRPTSRRQLRALASAPGSRSVSGAASDDAAGRRSGGLVRVGGLAQAGQEDFSLAASVGGPRGVVEALVPGILFVTAYSVTRDLRTSITVAVAASVVAFLARVVTRSNPTQAVSGLVGVVVCAVFAARSGDARDFYVPGFLTNVAYGAVYLLSTIPFPRFRVPGTRVHAGPGPFPLLGLLLGPLTGEGLSWRRDPRRMRAYQRVTWLWAAVFALRLAVQLPLYFADAVGPLGVARLAMGVPLFATAAWLTWMVLRAVPVAPKDGIAEDDGYVVRLTKG